ncbi:hypothetical protein J416_12694 [Gracilibacillus halophilus YIM-C55.5]|uniref:DUF4901 domain-containing protein n=1 Tax=Gracilibacillus halophilus YIM-C55.5 TaxID=1308866 RepID=N4WIW6_9BACI|nr:hypothetical protein [Gracilibacillus halophilus]ENH96062.1 hypothetical protein J416_12694 [Gracilibacillus halophilus YIM-C55.5]
MDARLKPYLDLIEKKFDLKNYTFKDYHLSRKVNIFNETVYSLTIEWLPEHASVEEDGSNPDGTASIDIDIHTKQVYSAIFVNGLTYSSGPTFKSNDLNQIISWIETETGLSYEKQFKLTKQEDRQFLFTACWNGTAIYPGGSIDVRLDQEGRIVFYSVIEPFPSDGDVYEESFALTLHKVDKIAEKQWQFIDYPDYEAETITPVYGIEEIFIGNDNESTQEYLPYSYGQTPVNQVLTWRESSTTTFEFQKVELTEEVTLDQAFRQDPHPDLTPISLDEIDRIVQLSQRYFSQTFPNESGGWILSAVQRTQGYLIAKILKSSSGLQLFPRKVSLIFDSDGQHLVNEFDNHVMQEMIEDFHHQGEVNISHQTTFQQIKPYLTLEPYYVYQPEHRQFRLYGKLDTSYGVNATTGEIKPYFE